VERDISNVTNSVSLPKQADTAEVSSFGDAAKNFIGGLLDSTLSVDCSRDATVEGYLDGILGVTTTYAYCPEGSASGKIKFSGTIIGTGLTPTSAIGDANKMTFTAQGCGTVTRTTL
jgi:hypothetical protein